MSVDRLYADIGERGLSGIETTTGFDWLLIPALVIIGSIIIAIIVSVLMKVFLSSRKVSLDWEEFETLLQRLELSHEEASFIRTSMRKQGYSFPSKVLRKEGEFDKFTKKVLRRPNHHHEFLLQMIRKKAFTGQTFSSSKSTVKEQTPFDPVEKTN